MQTEKAGLESRLASVEAAAAEAHAEQEKQAGDALTRHAAEMQAAQAAMEAVAGELETKVAAQEQLKQLNGQLVTRLKESNMNAAAAASAELETKLAAQEQLKQLNGELMGRLKESHDNTTAMETRASEVAQAAVAKANKRRLAAENFADAAVEDSSNLEPALDQVGGCSKGEQVLLLLCAQALNPQFGMALLR